MTKAQIYDELSRVLTDYETAEHRVVDCKCCNWEGELYRMLTEIQNRWEDTITAEES
jgi:hypothetical protein